MSHSRHEHHTYTILHFENNNFLTSSDSFSSSFKIKLIMYDDQLLNEVPALR